MRFNQELCLTLICLMMLISSAGGQGLHVGQPFPDIRLPSLANGRPLSISHFRGKKVLLMIFASW